ncbi:MAG: phosphatidylserine decarboxylase [candidate division NC10 bacterium]|nr:phosphatidylserine decarboxylase [candidate division NC10 bacterium]
MIPVARDAFLFLIPLLGIAGALFLLRLPGWGLLPVILAVGVGFFFRDPERVVPEGPGVVVAPADGRVTVVRQGVGADGEGPGPFSQVSIFLSVLDVHVNRAPYGGKVEDLKYRPGRFLVAWREEASRVNEQTVIALATPDGPITVKQIAGVLARRVVTWIRPGQELKTGERIGLIRFGSRVDLLVPRRVTLAVKVGDKVRGGETVVGVFR